MCDLCNQGSLGYAPDGERAFCDCHDGVRAALKAGCRLVCLYSDQLAVFDRRVPLPPKMQRICNLIWLAYDGECSVHDQLEARLEVTR